MNRTTTIKIFVSCILMLFVMNSSMSAQSTQWANDVPLNSVSLENQTNARISVAFNGWIYAMYMFEDAPGHHEYHIRRSKDNGATFHSIFVSNFISTLDPIEADMVVTGTDTTNLLISVLSVEKDTSGTASNSAHIFCYGKDGAFLGARFTESNTGTFFYHHCAIASDYRAPGTIGTPYSITAIVAEQGIHDSLIYIYSIDGGQTFNRRTIYATTSLSDYIGRVAIASGASSSSSFGRTGIAFEQRHGGWNDGVFGNIGTFYGYNDMSTGVYFDGIPLWIDSSSYSPGLNRHPSVALSQSTTANNDSANITMVVTTEEIYNGATNDNDISLMSVMYETGPFENSFVHYAHVAHTTNNEKQCNVTYDPVFTHFLFTYYDSTTAYLAYGFSNLNLPTSPTLLGGNFRDATGLMQNPWPRVDINPALGQVALVWNDDAQANGIAYFDAEFALVVVPRFTESASGITRIYPNPSHGELNINYMTKAAEDVMMEVYDIMGKIIYTEKLYPTPGTNTAKLNVAQYEAGQYILHINSESAISTTRFLVIK